jgi:hypothetical protein
MRLNPRITWRQISSAVLSLSVFSAVWIQPTRAQSQDSRQQDIQQLKDKLEQLDQMMKEVREELTALEGAEQHPPGARPVAQGKYERRKAGHGTWVCRQRAALAAALWPLLLAKVPSWSLHHRWMKRETA